MASEPTVAIGAAVPSRGPERAMFIASDRFLPLEYLRVPHRVASNAARTRALSNGRVPTGFASLTVDDGGQSRQICIGRGKVTGPWTISCRRAMT